MRSKPRLLFSEGEQAPPEQPTPNPKSKPPLWVVFPLASPARFERAAFRLGGERSILLSYGDKYAVLLRANARRGKRNYTEAAV